MKSFLLIAFMICCGGSVRALVDKDNIYFVILAGGNGERLWPLSRQNRPKQLLTIGPEKTLLQQAIDRVDSLVCPKNIWISTTKRHESSIRNHVGNRIGRIIVEPSVRNTGPAILLSCLKLYEENPDAIVIFLPADPFIPDKDYGKFVAFLEHVINFSLTQNKITLLGVKPTYAATGYGYIQFDKSSHFQAPYQVVKFREKPSFKVAQEYFQSDDMLWNIGMFGAKVSVFLDEFKQCATEIYQGVQAFVRDKDSYEQIKSDSIDYAVMEKSKNICVLPVDFAWCDVGSIEVFLSIKQKYGAPESPNIMIDAGNNLIDVPDKLVALIGLDNLCVVESDQALLIVRRDQAEKVKEVVRLLKQERNEYL